MDTDLSVRETAARAVFEVIPPTHRHDAIAFALEKGEKDD